MMELETKQHYMRVCYQDELFFVDTIFYGSKNMLLKDSQDNLLCVGFDEVEHLYIQFFSRNVE